MNTLTTEPEILDRAVTAIQRETGLHLDVIDREVPIADSHRRIDAIVQIAGSDKPIMVEVKKWASHVNLGSMVSQLLLLAEPGEALLVADYINQNRAETLKHQGIQFIDTLGNAHINQPPVFIYITGNKPKSSAEHIKQQKTGRAFSPSGMRVVFALLKNPELINAPYRKIAMAAKVALGTVGWALHDLTTQGFLLEGVKRHQRKVVDFNGLIDKWVEAYPYQLKAKHRLGVFTCDDSTWWKTIKAEKLNALWAGEVAAAQYTNYLNPQNAVVYIDKADAPTFLQKARLRVAKANHLLDRRIDLIQPFWLRVDEPTNSIDCVHPLIVYADLIESGETRSLETARRIREEYLH